MPQSGFSAKYEEEVVIDYIFRDWRSTRRGQMFSFIERVHIHIGTSSSSSFVGLSSFHRSSELIVFGVDFLF